MGYVVVLLSACDTTIGLTLYTPDSISRMIKSGFIDFAKQSAACVAVSIQLTRSPPPG